MKSIHKSVLIPHSASDMFALVTDVASYPQFLPWCASTCVLAQDESGMTAQINMAVAGFRHSFTTRNSHLPEQRIAMTLVEGPFSHLEGCWQFMTLGHANQAACKVSFELRYAFGSQAVAAVLGPVFDKVAGSLVDAFVKRADEVHG